MQNYFLRIIGDERYDNADEEAFAKSWLSRYGLAIEPVALDFHQDKTGLAITRRAEQHFHPMRSYVSCTLDGYRAHDSTVIDVKAVGAWRDIEETVQWYTPQMIVQMECLKAANASLLIVKGGAEPVECPIFMHSTFIKQVWQAVDQFWFCCQRLIPPCEMSFTRLVSPEQWRTIDLDEDMPNWAPQMRSLLGEWERNEEGAKAFEAAKAEVKKLLPDDVGLVQCGSLQIKRMRNNAVWIRRSS